MVFLARIPSLKFKHTVRFQFTDLGDGGSRGWKVSSSLRGRPTYEEELAAPILGVQWQSLKSEAKT